MFVLLYSRGYRKIEKKKLVIILLEWDKHITLNFVNNQFRK